MKRSGEGIVYLELLEIKVWTALSPLERVKMAGVVLSSITPALGQRSFWVWVPLKKVRMAGVVASKVRKQRAKERPSLKEAKEEEKRPIKVYSYCDIMWNIGQMYNLHIRSIIFISTEKNPVWNKVHDQDNLRHEKWIWTKRLDKNNSLLKCMFKLKPFKECKIQMFFGCKDFVFINLHGKIRVENHLNRNYKSRFAKR